MSDRHDPHADLRSEQGGVRAGGRLPDRHGGRPGWSFTSPAPAGPGGPPALRAAD